MDKKKIKESKDYFKNQGIREYCIWYLYDKVASALDIESALNLSRNSAGKVISRNRSLFEIDHNDKKKRYWKLSEEGKRLVESIIRECERIQKEREEREQYSAKEEDYTHLFNEIIEYLELKKHILTGDVLLFDLSKLSEVDPNFCDKFIAQYEEYKSMFLKYIKEHFDKNVKLRPINPPAGSEIELPYLSAEKHLNKLIQLTAIVEYRSEAKEGVYLKSKFECPSCSAFITKKHEGDEYKTPRACSCGNRSGFKIIEEQTDDFLELIIKNKGVSSARFRINLEIQGKDLIRYLSNKISNGKAIEIVGLYKSRPKFIRNKKTNQFSSYILAENIQAVNEDDLDLDFSDDEKEDFYKIATQVEENGLEPLLPLIFPSSITVSVGQEVISKAWILQMVAGRNVFGKRGIQIRRKPHIFCYGDPSTDKSRKVTFAKMIDPMIKDVNGATTSSAGLLLGMDSFDNKRFISGGVLVEADNSIVIVDEIQKFDKEARGTLHDVLASQRLKYDKLSFNIEEFIDVSMSFFGNPPKDTFSSKKIYQQILNVKDRFGEDDPQKAFFSRCDLVVGIRDIKNEDTDREIIRAKFREKDEDVNNTTELEAIRKFIYYAKNTINPKLSKEAREAIEGVITLIRQKITEWDITHRLTESYIIFSECFAKLRLSNTIEQSDVERTHDLYIKSLDSIEVFVPQDVKDYFND